MCCRRQRPCGVRVNVDLTGSEIRTPGWLCAVMRNRCGRGCGVEAGVVVPGDVAPSWRCGEAGEGLAAATAGCERPRGEGLSGREGGEHPLVAHDEQAGGEHR